MDIKIKGYSSDNYLMLKLRATAFQKAQYRTTAVTALKKWISKIILLKMYLVHTYKVS